MRYNPKPAKHTSIIFNIIFERCLKMMLLDFLQIITSLGTLPGTTNAKACSSASGTQEWQRSGSRLGMPHNTGRPQHSLWMTISTRHDDIRGPSHMLWKFVKHVVKHVVTHGLVQFWMMFDAFPRQQLTAESYKAEVSLSICPIASVLPPRYGKRLKPKWGW